MTVCMYCGGKIPQRKGTPPPPSGKAPEIGARGAPKGPAGAKRSAGTEGEAEGDEEGGGLTAFLQPGEQVLIGSLNVSVKKFFFHAYLTNQRIFLIDTQEKKLKVTAKDVPLSTISGSIVEFSESSDPVLVLSIRSADDEIKTMKLVFTGNGLDRSGEIDEWVELLNEQIQPKKPKKPAEEKRPEPEPEEPEEEGEEHREEEADEEALQRIRKPQISRQESGPVKRPAKNHEKQPPVKRLLPLYQAPSEEEMEDLPPQPRRTPRGVSGEKDTSAHPPAGTVREILPSREPAAKPVKRVEVQSAMKSALKTGVPLSRSPAEKSAGSPVTLKKPVHVRPEPAVTPAPDEEMVIAHDGSESEEVEETAGPVFCQNCGKKLPAAANFCPGCGIRITATREKPALKDAPGNVRKPDEAAPVRNEQKADEQPRPARPPVKKAPKGSEMTILHKFLRR